MPLSNIAFQNEDENIKTAAYLYHFNYKENLPKDFVLLTRGEENQNGYMKIWLSSKEGGRVLKMMLIGDDGKEI